MRPSLLTSAGARAVKVTSIASTRYCQRMLARWGIRLAASLIGIALGIIVSAAVLSGFSTTTTGVVEATIVFWIVHLIVNFLALRVLIRQPSVALAGLLALASTIIALIIVNVIVSDITIQGTRTYIGATLIIWIATALADMIGGRKIRDRRRL